MSDELTKIIDSINKAISQVDTMKICRSDKKLKVLNALSSEDKYNYIICICGGLNGRGIWSNYFEGLAKMMFNIELCYPNAFLHKIENDAIDDVFYVYVGISKEVVK